MLYLFLGILAGMGLPMQTSVNTALKKKVGTPFLSGLISFSVALAALIAVLLLSGIGLSLPFDHLSSEPVWIWFGGILGATFLTGNIFLFQRLGGVQTVMFPVMGQILMGLIIDHAGWFRATQISLSLSRGAGALLAFAGLMIVALSKQSNTGGTQKHSSFSTSTSLILWQILAILLGMISAAQTAINGYLGRIVEAPLKATAVSFAVGVCTLLVICCIRRIFVGKTPIDNSQKYPKWIWIGGFFGAFLVFVNTYLAQRIGTGMTVVAVLTGQTAGGLLVDNFGLFHSPVKKITPAKIAGVVCMLLGAAMIRLL